MGHGCSKRSGGRGGGRQDIRQRPRCISTGAADPTSIRLVRSTASKIGWFRTRSAAGWKQPSGDRQLGDLRTADFNAPSAWPWKCGGRGHTPGGDCGNSYVQIRAQCRCRSSPASTDEHFLARSQVSVSTLFATASNHTLTSPTLRASRYSQVPNLPVALIAAHQRLAACALISVRPSQSAPLISTIR
jgi:hypothetical protein